MIVGSFVSSFCDIIGFKSPTAKVFAPEMDEELLIDV